LRAWTRASTRSRRPCRTCARRVCCCRRRRSVRAVCQFVGMLSCVIVVVAAMVVARASSCLSLRCCQLLMLSTVAFAACRSRDNGRTREHGCGPWSVGVSVSVRQLRVHENSPARRVGAVVLVRRRRVPSPPPPSLAHTRAHPLDSRF
jgi:hypothetical protein